MVLRTLMVPDPRLDISGFRNWASGTKNIDHVMLLSFLKFSLTPIMNLQASGCACLAVMAAGVATSGYFTVALILLLRQGAKSNSKGRLLQQPC